MCRLTTLRHLATSSADGRRVMAQMKESIVSIGLKRMEQILSFRHQNSDASETERADEELYLWKQLIDELEKVIYSKNTYGI